MKNKIKKIHLVYELLGPLKKRFWICVVLIFSQALWEGVVLISMAAFFQSLVDITGFSGGNLEQTSFLNNFYELFKQIPEERRVLIGFFFLSGSMLLSSLIKIGVFTYQTKFSTLYIYRIRSTAFSSLNRNSLTFFDNNKKGELIQMVINESRACYSVLKGILGLIINSFKAAVFIFFMLMLSIKLTLIVIVFTILFLAENYYMSKAIKRLSKIVVAKTRKLTVTTDESIQGIKHIKLLNYYRRAETSFNQSCWDADFSNRKASLIMQWQATISQIFGLTTFFVLVYFSFKHSLLAVSLLLTFLYILQRLYQALATINQQYGFINNNLPAMNKIISFFKEAKIQEEMGGKIIKEKLINEKIAFKGVSLSYGKEEILENISMDIYKGQTVALVGDSGAGKTSLANMFVRLYDADKGDVLIDDVNIKDYDLTFLRDHIGVVNQDPIIFNTTVRDNIMMGNPDLSEEEMIEASKKAYAHEFIINLPQSYDTLVGDRGAKLSGGQRQRINIAQIFLKNPELMILDEATSALDTKSEQYIHKALEKLAENHTSIIIAHRLSTIKKADIIIVLFEGKIIEQGSWSSLLEARGIFYDMVQRQSFDGDFNQSDIKTFRTNKKDIKQAKD